MSNLFKKIIKFFKNDEVVESFFFQEDYPQLIPLSSLNDIVKFLNSIRNDEFELIIVSKKYPMILDFYGTPDDYEWIMSIINPIIKEINVHPDKVTFFLKKGALLRLRALVHEKFTLLG